MNADCDFQIGKDHLVCQDYALTERRENEAVAILCDGCSASPDVDIGARMLALAAREVFLNQHDLNYAEFGQRAIDRAARIWDVFPMLNPRALDATLLFASVNGTKMRAFLYGDGVFFHKSPAGLYAMKVELTSGAPDYLSYTLDEERKTQYVVASDADKEVKRLEIQDENGTGSFEYPPFAPVVITREVQAGDIVAVCSDGIGSFRKPDNAAIPWLEMAEEFIGFKSFPGVFVKRHLAALKRKCQKENWTYRDDISVAAIVV